MYHKKIYVLNPSQSKRLIAKGIVTEPRITQALNEGKIFVGRGTTNSYVLEELFKAAEIDVKFNKGDYVAGIVDSEGNKCKWSVNKGPLYPEILIDKGKKVEVKDRVSEVKKFGRNDIILKGANALDINDVPGVLIRAGDGGTIGSMFPTIMLKGLTVICPIGLEKVIQEDIIELSLIMGVDDVIDGAGIIPMPFAESFTEVEALEILFDCEVYHVASGGVRSAAGSVSLLVGTETDEEFTKIDEFMKNIIEEPDFVPN